LPVLRMQILHQQTPAAFSYGFIILLILADRMYLEIDLLFNTPLVLDISIFVKGNMGVCSFFSFILHDISYDY
jgi:hypothetical protein